MISSLISFVGLEIILGTANKTKALNAQILVRNKDKWFMNVPLTNAQNLLPFRKFDLIFFTFTALYFANKFSNEQQILRLKNTRSDLQWEWVLACE